MKKKVIASVLAAALAAMSVSAAVYADDEVPNDEEFYEEFVLFELGGEKIELYTDKYSSDSVMHIELKKPPEGTMTLNLRFITPEKTYELMYILMVPEQVMDIPLNEIMTALKERYPNETIPLDKLTSVELDDIGWVDSIEALTNSELAELYADASGDAEGDDEEDDDDDNARPTIQYDLASDKISLFADAAANGANLHIELKEPPEGTMTLNMEFKFNDRYRELMYILMMPEQVMDIPLSDIVTALNERYPDETLDYGALKMVTIYDKVLNIDDIYIEDNYDPAAPEFITEENIWKLSDSGMTLADANGVAGGNVGLVMEFDSVLENGYYIEFVFTLDDGTTETVTESGSEALSTSTLFVKVRDLLKKAGVDVMSVTDFEVVNMSDQNLVSVNISTMPGGDEDSSPAETNPATGTGLAVCAMLASGALCAISRKRK